MFYSWTSNNVNAILNTFKFIALIERSTDLLINVKSDPWVLNTVSPDLTHLEFYVILWNQFDA